MPLQHADLRILHNRGLILICLKLHNHPQGAKGSHKTVRLTMVMPYCPEVTLRLHIHGGDEGYKEKGQKKALFRKRGLYKYCQNFIHTGFSDLLP